MCHRRFGIGADGIILLQPSNKADFRMRIFNNDGGEPEMCGNGIRCLIHFIRSLGFTQKQYQIEIKERIVPCAIEGDVVTVDLGKFKWLSEHVVDTGVPHAVVFVESLEKIDLEVKGRELRESLGSNVNFALREPSGAIRVRTYERGVEGETLACGTGAAAVGVVARARFSVQNPVKILCASSEELLIEVGEESVRMTGTATFVFHGEFAIPKMSTN
jgi:diaminopimelate epimerase